MRVTDEELRSLERAFKDANPPDATVQLQWLRPTILNFFRDGYSKRLTFQFLKSADLVRCSQATFYRWVSNNMDFEPEVGDVPTNVPSAPSIHRAKAGVAIEQAAFTGEHPPVPALPESPQSAGENGATLVHEPPRRNERKKLSDEERRRLVSSLNVTLAEMERNSLGATFDRVQARLEKRDHDEAAK